MAPVVPDAATENGAPVEITDDWYAQDTDGNVWYLGEASAELQERQVLGPRGLLGGRSRRRASRDRATPANPVAGLSYRQEYYKGVAEDRGAIVTVGQERVEVPAGFFSGQPPS